MRFFPGLKIALKLHFGLGILVRSHDLPPIGSVVKECLPKWPYFRSMEFSHML